MAAPRPNVSLLASAIPALLVLSVALLVLFVAPEALRIITHQQTLHQVQQASLRLHSGIKSDVDAGLDSGRDLRITPASTSFLDQLNQASRDVATFVRPSVVHISAQQKVDPNQPFAGISTGSGWIWDADGHVLTNWHVVADADRIDVQLHDGTVRSATLVGHDPTTDIAVIRIPAGRLIAATRASMSEDINQGSIVFAFGSPMDFRFSMSQGIVSGLGRSVGLFRSRNSIGYENFIQVDAAINPGNSGGPLSNHRGEVIGMNTAIATHDTSSEGRFSGIGLAIPLDMIESVATQVIDGGVVRKGFLGVSVVDQHSPVYRWLGPLGLPSTGGAVVSSVSEGLAQAGLVRGDVIARYDDLVVQDPDAFWRLVADDGDGRSRLAVWRANPDEATSEWIDVLIEAPEIDGGRTASHKDLHLINLIDDMSSYYRDIGFERTGVLVVSTQPGQPARQGGVRSGDIICGINGREMNTVDQLRSTVSSILPNALVELAIWRPTGNSSRMLTLEIRLTELERRVR